jgi:succinyl-CoA synthetase beta subunit
MISERKAMQKQIGYVHIGQHEVGVISNGGGLCMATLDMLAE